MEKASGDGRRAGIGRARLERQLDYLNMCDMHNALTPYITAKQHQERMLDMMNLANLHGG
jgi:hypothetical protein